MGRRKLVVGNWKMNGMQAALDEVAAIGARAAQHPAVEVGLCLPATLIAMADARKGGAFIGAQDCHSAVSGAHTGCLSASMLAEAGASWTIVGHSERRQDQNETDGDVAAKALAGIEGKTIVLVGALAPARFGESDASFNLGMAFATAQVAEAGVYITMSGSVFRADHVIKDRAKGAFVPLP